jgi:hypothetical protein
MEITKELQKFNVTDAAIQELSTRYMPQVGEGCHQLVKDVQIHLTKTAAYIRKSVKEL